MMFLVGQTWSRVLLALALTLSGAVANPGNDNLDQAMEVSGPAFVLAANLADATPQSFEPETPGLNGKTVWWRWTAPYSGICAWRTSTDFQRVAVMVLEADGLGQWNVLAQTYLRPGLGLMLDNFAPDTQGSFPARAGHHYWIRLDGVGGGEFNGAFPPNPSEAPYRVSVEFWRLDLPSAAHDAFEHRQALTQSPATLGGTLVTATAEPGEPAAHEASVNRTLWWEWEAPGRGTASIEFVATNDAPLVAVYRRAPWQQLVPVASSATTFGNACARFWHSRGTLQFDAEPGETYYLQLDAFPDYDLSREFEARFRFQPAPANDLVSTPMEVSGHNWSVLASNEGATSSAGDPSVPGSSGASSVWYRWRLPSPGLVQITTNEPTQFAELGVEVLPPGGSTGSSSVITVIGLCDDPFADLFPPPPFMPVLSLFRTIGSVGDQPTLEYRNHGTNEVWAEMSNTDLWVQLDSPQGVGGTAILNGRLTPPPPNNLRAAAVSLPSAAVRVTGRSAGATSEIDELLPPSTVLPHAIDRVPQRTVWWEWKAPATGTWAFRVDAGSYENAFLVYRGRYDADAVPAATTFFEPVVFQAQAGENFQIGVFGVSGLGGNLQFRISEASLPTLGPPSLDFNAAGQPWWRFEIPTNWDLPFEVETSADLRAWTPMLTDWIRGAGAFHLPFDSEATVRFVRFRLSPR